MKERSLTKLDMQGREQHAKLSVTFLMSEVPPVKAAENDDDIGTLVTTFDETPQREKSTRYALEVLYTQALCHIARRKVCTGTPEVDGPAEALVGIGNKLSDPTYQSSKPKCLVTPCDSPIKFSEDSLDLV
jgi:hypothetical protein